MGFQNQMGQFAGNQDASNSEKIFTFQKSDGDIIETTYPLIIWERGMKSCCVLISYK